MTCKIQNFLMMLNNISGSANTDPGGGGRGGVGAWGRGGVGAWGRGGVGTFCLNVFFLLWQVLLCQWL